MNKSLIALAVLGAFAGVASAQSSVTLYGTVDLNGRYIKNDGSARRLSLSQDGLNSSQLGFRGIEDLGGGLKAGFTLLGSVSADTGSVSTTKFFGRRSTVSLFGANWGEVRLGRDYVPSYVSSYTFDPFGNVGIGNFLNVAHFASQPTRLRADNSIGYFLPSNLGGFYGQAMVAAGEGSTNTKYYGGRVGFAAGPFDVALALGAQDVAAARRGYKTANIGGSYDFGVAKLMGQYSREKLQVTSATESRENSYLLGVVVPVWQGEIHASWARSDLSNSSNDANLYALGYVYNLSKRTALYATVADIKNKGAQNFSVSSGTISGSSAITALPTDGGSSRGAEFGIRHFF